MPTVELETTGERLVRGTLEHRVAVLTYHGLRRTVEPHMVGLHEAGEPMLIGYQIEGGSHSGPVPGWRTFITTEIHEVELLEQRFEPRGLDPAARRMLEVFARA